MLPHPRRPDQAIPAARRLYAALVARARDPIFHTSFSVPDTIDGRFDLLTLHAFLVLDAVKSQGPGDGKLGTELASVIFAGFDEALRELGVGDFGLSRRMKAMAGAFYGRLESYHAAGSAAALIPVVTRNLYRGDAARTDEATSLAYYILSARTHLASQATALFQGDVDFGPLPAYEPAP